ncbi:MAG: hypothetical protein LBU89_05035 [Fibromonadaceae bacterium]|jgi:hypothetical protein|nr:hypothetical protein [Fibromonadaceae bacterium]
MIKKVFIFSVFFAFFAFFSSACSWPKPKEEPLNLVFLDHEWTQSTEGSPFPWDSIDGFFPNKEHPYGFDRHTKPGNNRLDSIVYASVLDGGYGKVNLKINQGPGNSLGSFYYYICDPESKYPYRSLATIDNLINEQSYTFTASIAEDGDVKKIALCKVDKVGTEIVQELHIYPYNWKDDYDFYIYILGDSLNGDSRHQLLRSEEFWDLFDTVFSQAVVKYGRLFGEYKTVDRGYILTRVNGRYTGCANSSAINEAVSYLSTNALRGGQKRNVIQVGYPTKRFWPLRGDGNGNIQICGTPILDQSPTRPDLELELELETLPNSECSKIEADVIRDRSRGVWMLRYKDGKPEEIATVDNVNLDCMVFADANLGDYVGEIGNSAALATPYLYTTIVIQPWLGDSTAKTALHELGHTMGLMDILREPPSYTEYNDEENNLMTQGGGAKSLRLRKRGIQAIEEIFSLASADCSYIFTLDGVEVDSERWEEAGVESELKCIEYQWDCLHNVKGACINPILDPYGWTQ